MSENYKFENDGPFVSWLFKVDCSSAASVLEGIYSTTAIILTSKSPHITTKCPNFLCKHFASSCADLCLPHFQVFSQDSVFKL